MAELEDLANSTAFLRGGGRMAKLVANFDWTTTSLGPLTTWSPSLKNAVSLILASHMPTAVLWGEEGVTIYNEAYATLIGRRHPRVLGQKMCDAWPDYAPRAVQMMKSVLAGETLTFRDIELTVYRSNQAAEQIWMSSQCSPVRDEAGQPAGALIVCVENTERVLAERRAAIELNRLRTIFEQAPGFISMLSGPDHVYEFVNEAHKRLFGDRDVVGKPIREVFPDLPDQSYVQMLDRIYATGERFVARAFPVLLPSRDRGVLEEHILDYVFEPITDKEGHVVGVFAEGFDVTEPARAQAAAEESECRLSAAVAIARLGAFEWDLDMNRATLDDRAREIFGFSPDEGDLEVNDVVRRIDPDDYRRLAAESNAAQAEGRTRHEFEFRIRLPGGSTRNIATVSDTLTGPDGRPTRVMGVFNDVTEQKRAEAHQRLLINELNHRVKNTLATVQSIAAQTLRSAPDLKCAKDAFEARLVALASAHDLLTAQSWHGAPLSDVVARAMTAFEATPHAISLSGPPIWLSAPRALALSFALHELATNAAKYGALSAVGGRVTIRWSSIAGELNLRWIERGGPPVTTPTHTGFGTRLLQRGLAHELHGEVTLTFAPEGVHCQIRCPLEDEHRAPAAVEAK
ncbi:PAS domain-containing protein [Phenylobacterium sp. LjRoot219]|uniref:sensor histidine kinase n=1 Tax=Phenylobacterium sp. LjRoot219 TaxID=3342283 RepID=UPI003ECCE8BB